MPTALAEQARQMGVPPAVLGLYQLEPNKTSFDSAVSTLNGGLDIVHKLPAPLATHVAGEVYNKAGQVALFSPEGLTRSDRKVLTNLRKDAPAVLFDAHPELGDAAAERLVKEWQEWQAQEAQEPRESKPLSFSTGKRKAEPSAPAKSAEEAPKAPEQEKEKPKLQKMPPEAISTETSGGNIPIAHPGTAGFPPEILQQIAEQARDQGVQEGANAVLGQVGPVIAGLQQQAAAGEALGQALPGMLAGAQQEGANAVLGQVGPVIAGLQQQAAAGEALGQALPGMLAGAQQEGAQRGAQAATEEILKKIKGQAPTKPAGSERTRTRGSQGSSRLEKIGEGLAGTARVAETVLRAGYYAPFVGVAWTWKKSGEFYESFRDGQREPIDDLLAEERLRKGLRQTVHNLEGLMEEENRDKAPDGLLTTEELAERIRPDVTNFSFTPEVSADFTLGLVLGRALANQLEGSETKGFDIDPEGVELYQAMDEYGQKLSQVEARRVRGERVSREEIVELKEEWEELYEESSGEPAWSEDFTERFGRLPDGEMGVEKRDREAVDQKEVEALKEVRDAMLAQFAREMDSQRSEKETRGSEDLGLAPESSVVPQFTEAGVLNLDWRLVEPKEISDETSVKR